MVCPLLHDIHRLRAGEPGELGRVDPLDAEPGALDEPGKTLERALKLYDKGDYYSSATSAYQIQPGDPRSLVVSGTYSF